MYQQVIVFGLLGLGFAELTVFAVVGGVLFGGKLPEVAYWIGKKLVDWNRPDGDSENGEPGAGLSGPKPGRGPKGRPGVSKQI